MTERKITNFWAASNA